MDFAPPRDEASARVSTPLLRHLDLALHGLHSGGGLLHLGELLDVAGPLVRLAQEHEDVRVERPRATAEGLRRKASKNR